MDREMLNLQLQITIELIAIHLQQRSGRQSSKVQTDEGRVGSHPDRQCLLYLLQKLNVNLLGTSLKASADLTLLQETLRLPLSAIQQGAATSSSDDLEQFNIAMKPYLKQVSINHIHACMHTYIHTTIFINTTIRPDLSSCQR